MNRPVSPVRPLRDDDEVQAAALTRWRADHDADHRHVVRATVLALAVYIAGLLLSAAVLGLIAVAWTATGNHLFGVLLAGLVAAITVAYAYLTREL